MIDGVVIKQLTKRQDVSDTEESSGNGFLVEVLRDDDQLLRRFGQSTYTVAWPGTIKAFHWHKKQDDLWFVASGRALVVLYDNRTGSATEGQTDVLECNDEQYQLLLIPAGVVHGYKVLGDKPVALFYHTTESYNPADPDEQRLAHDDPKIGFDWRRQS